jgi:hypothetical protein
MKDAGEDPAICLFSHKCSEQSHALADRLTAALVRRGVRLLVDPFRYGDDFEVGMKTFEFDALLFLLSPESWDSPACQVELATARRLAAPVFVIHQAGDIPAELKGRYALEPRGPAGRIPEGQIRELAEAIRARAALHKNLQLLDAANPPDLTREVAEWLATDGDRTALAERAPDLVRKYREIRDPTACFHIALALGRAGTLEAAELLRALPPKDHPYPGAGVSQALAMIAGGE